MNFQEKMGLIRRLQKKQNEAKAARIEIMRRWPDYPLGFHFLQQERALARQMADIRFTGKAVK